MKPQLCMPLCGFLLIASSIAPLAFADDPYNPPYDFDWNWTPETSAPANLISPLCGDVVEVQPAGWTLGDGCPSSQWGLPDRIVSTYGPRKQDDDFDFHRGVDFRTIEMEADNAPDENGDDPTHTTPIDNPRPVFATAAGSFVEVDYDSDDGYLVVVEHRALGVYTRYKHLSEIDSAILSLGQGDPVAAGRYLGLTGRSQSGNHHLHFEVRKVTPDGDTSHADEHTEATWMRNAIHPLRFVPYDPPKGTTTVTVTRDAGDSPTVDVDTDRWDLQRVFVTTCYWSSTTNSCHFPFFLPGSVPIDGYYVNPPFTDFELANYQYTHRGASRWDDFQVGGVDECPFVSDPDTGHDGEDYDGDYHLAEENVTTHSFNGVTTDVFGSSTHYHRTFHFDSAMQWTSGCAFATVTFLDGTEVEEDLCW